MVTIRMRGSRADCAQVLLDLTGLYPVLRGVALRKDRGASPHYRLYVTVDLTSREPVTQVAALLAHRIDIGRIVLAPHGRGARLLTRP